MDCVRPHQVVCCNLLFEFRFSNHFKIFILVQICGDEEKLYGEFTEANTKLFSRIINMYKYACINRKLIFHLWNRVLSSFLVQIYFSKFDFIFIHVPLYDPKLIFDFKFKLELIRTSKIQHLKFDVVTSKIVKSLF